ncbi:adenosylcobinamide-GDP ribazoletransferase [Caldisalinibacter kiritimatiensis]|uniref:Adenosylcobinamide-GDP ribazoletransferase n=1 Tax=Caldisalinibacter kiritimatiensis TaxID=1304284 RepID=R1ATD9_9FIRM|nr:adenosylcobinamide-GDP ribazoletransferase [Caldisalinibacter kiritimatiensis]EOD00388.1 Cobalamin synthase [Caldisalinibacter kiritimatiensis]
MKSLLLMLTFFTRLPIKYPFEYKEEDFIKGVNFVSLIGLTIGVLLWIISFSSIYLKKPITVLLIWLFYLWITGGLHIDGLADSFDGLFSNRDKERILEIMKDSRIGTFGVLAIIFTLIFNLVISYYLDYKTFIIMPVIGRSCAVIACSISDYARKERGMGKGFIENCEIKEVFFNLVITGIVALFVFNNYIFILGILLTFIIILLLTNKIKSKIGGMTGDTVGAIIEVSQSIFIFSIYLIKELMI